VSVFASVDLSAIGSNSHLRSSWIVGGGHTVCPFLPDGVIARPRCFRLRPNFNAAIYPGFRTCIAIPPGRCEILAMWASWASSLRKSLRASAPPQKHCLLRGALRPSTLSALKSFASCFIRILARRASMVALRCAPQLRSPVYRYRSDGYSTVGLLAVVGAATPGCLTKRDAWRMLIE